MATFYSSSYLNFFFSLGKKKNSFRFCSKSFSVLQSFSPVSFPIEFYTLLVGLLFPVMANSKIQEEIEDLNQNTNLLSWDDMSSLLKCKKGLAHQFKGVSLLGRLVMQVLIAFC